MFKPYNKYYCWSSVLQSIFCAFNLGLLIHLNDISLQHDNRAIDEKSMLFYINMLGPVTFLEKSIAGT